MICPRCRTPNDEAAVYCAGCGRPLLRKASSPRSLARPALFAAGAAAVVIAAFFLYRHFAPAAGPLPGRNTAGAGPDVSPAVEAAEGTLQATFGEAYAQGPGGREVFRTAVAVFDGGWAALPVAGLLGGEALTFQADGSAPRRVTSGTWGTGSPVAFWEVDSGYPPRALSLGTWNTSLPIDWYAARSADPPLRLEVDAARAAGPFACFPVPPQLMSPGVFIQQGAAVGWTFGEPFDQAYLWTGAPASGPPPGITADRFFSAVSSECREGYYRRFLDSGENPDPAAELEALARGFRRAPLLAPEDVPPELGQAAIVARMGALADDLVRSGQAAEVVRILDDQTVRDSADPVLAGAAILAQAEGKDYNRTMRRLEAIQRDVFAVRGLAPRELAEIKARLYKDWLRMIIEKGDYYSGAVAFEEARRAFPEDPEILLLGAELALSENDPARAREILESGTYPAGLADRADRLTARLDEAQDETEEIVISFDPKEEAIEVEAVINGSFTQKFILDTGATYVAIPTATAEALGIKLDEGIPAQATATASGIKIAFEVTLASIEVDTVRVDNVKALVLDMPLLPEYGLLGLNFFDAFDARLDRQNGVLRLRKKPL